MTAGDVRQQLTEALDEAQTKWTRRLAVPVWAEQAARELRLVERDRELLRFLAVWEETTGELLDCEQELAAAVTVGTLKRIVDLAAAFWLGTPEADR